MHRNRPHFGALIGRLANRLANGSFVLDGVRHQVDRNDGPNSLHGGSLGFDKRLWQVEELLTDPDWCTVVLGYTSESGEMGFPGRLTVLAGYTLTTDGVLRIEYTAETDAPTVVNLTNHSYWNLAGEGAGTIDDHVVTLAADAYTPVDGTLLPTGAIEPVAGTPLDFTEPAAIGARLDDDFEQLRLAGGYDFNYVLDRPDATSLVWAATLQEPASGRELEHLDDRAGDPALLGQPSGRNAHRHRRQPARLAGGSRLRDAALPRLAEPARLADDDVAAGRGLPLGDRVPARSC